MKTQPISRFPVPDLSDLPDDTLMDKETVNESDYQCLNYHGFDEDDIWDIGAISVFFGLSNRLVNMSSMRTNDEFYLMGRLPKQT